MDDIVDIVLFSFFIPVRDVVFSMRTVNKTCHKFTNTFFKCFKRSVSDFKANVYTLQSLPYARCSTCGKTRRCIRDPFDSIKGMTCWTCQPEFMSLTEAQRFVDHNVLHRISKIKKNGCTFFLKNDIVAYDYIFDGPNDRRIVREKKFAFTSSTRYDRVNAVIESVPDLSDTEKKDLNDTKYIESYVRQNRYGIRFIKRLIIKFTAIAKNVHSEIVNTLTDSQINIIKEKHLYFTLGTCLGWIINKKRINNKHRYIFDLEKMNNEKNAFLQLVQTLEVLKTQKTERKTNLTLALQRHGLTIASIDKYPYVLFGVPTIRETCEQVHQLKWLHDNTPFCRFVEQNKRDRGYTTEWIRPDPYYNMIYSVCVEAKAMVLSLGYQCPPFVFIP